MSKDKKTICWLSDSTTLPTGYATMTLNILNGLSKDYDCHQLAHNFTGQTLVPPIKFEDGSSINFKLHGNGMRPYYEDLIGVKLKELDADVFVTLLDTFMVTPFFPNYNFGKAKTIFYFPSDGGSGIPLGCENVLKKMDIPIAMAKFGQKQVEDMYGIKCRYIPHGVDSKMFHPLSIEEKLKLRQKFHLVDKFVIGVVARNQGRKMLDRTLKAFKLFIDKAPNAVLLLHCDPNDPAAIFPMQKMIERYKLQNRVLFTGMKYYKGFTYKEMNNVYNLFDVFLLTTSGEGFGVPLIEAMSCEIPIVATDYTTTREIVIDHNAGLPINLVGTIKEENPWVHENEILNGTLTGGWSVERGICDLKHCAEQLKLLYDNLNMRKEMGKNGRQAVLKEYDWSIVIPQWKKVMEELTRL